MAIIIKGKIVGIDQNEIKPGPGSKKNFDPFTIYRYYIADGNGAPIQVSSTKDGRDNGQDVEMKVWEKLYLTKHGSPGREFREIVPR